MGLLSDVTRYYVLTHPRAERIAHRVESVVRSSAQAREIRRSGSTRIATFGTREVVLDISNLREFLMYRALSTGGGLAYETGTSRLILAALEPDSVFVDVGANIGYFTVLGLSRLSSGGRGIAFEPNPRTFGRLSQIVTAQDFPCAVQLINAALSDADGFATLFHSPVEDGRDSLTPVGTRGTPIPTMRLDHFDLSGRKIVMKIDVEGAEEKVLAGMSGVIAGGSSVSIALEWNPPYAGPSLWSAIRDRFSVYRIEEGTTHSLYPVSSMMEIRRRLTNLWLVRHGDRLPALPPAPGDAA
jgi:FkbM family methyltransferase